MQPAAVLMCGELPPTAPMGTIAVLIHVFFKQSVTQLDKLFFLHFLPESHPKFKIHTMNIIDFLQDCCKACIKGGYIHGLSCPFLPFHSGRDAVWRSKAVRCQLRAD